MEEEIKQEIIDTVEILEPSYNRNDNYIPTEYQIIDYQKSWKKCHCGRQTWFNDNWCPACGQKLGRPSADE